MDRIYSSHTLNLPANDDDIKCVWASQASRILSLQKISPKIVNG